MPTTPYAEALAKLHSRTVRPADLSSAEWSDLPVQLRERAFFSARTTNAHYLQEVRDRVEKMLNPQTITRKDVPVTEGLDLATARMELKDILHSIGYSPDSKDSGTIKDLSSDNRLNLLLTHNVKTAQGYGWHKQGQDPDLLDQWPAQELFRAEDRHEPRNWEVRWNNARGQLVDATTALDGRVRMVALKNDPIWVAISAFGTPYPPFDFNSGMDVRDISRSEAEQLGLSIPEVGIESDSGTINDNLEASTHRLSEEFLSRLKSEFGGQIKIEADAIRWLGSPKEEFRLKEERALSKEADRERLVVFDHRGISLLNRTGDKSSVPFYPHDWPILKDAVVTHNHPGGTSFSNADIIAAVTTDAAEIRAVGVGQPYTYALKRPERGWPKDLPSDHRDANRAVYEQISKLLNSGRLTIGEANRIHAHKVMQLVASKHHLHYERIKRP